MRGDKQFHSRRFGQNPRQSICFGQQLLKIVEQQQRFFVANEVDDQRHRIFGARERQSQRFGQLQDKAPSVGDIGQRHKVDAVEELAGLLRQQLTHRLDGKAGFAYAACPQHGDQSAVGIAQLRRQLSLFLFAAHKMGRRWRQRRWLDVAGGHNAGV